MNRKKILLIISFLLISGAAILGFSYHQAMNKPVVFQTFNLEINKGDTFDHIASELEAGGLNVNRYWFKLAAYQKKVINKLKAGEYELPAGTSLMQIINILAEGRSKKYAVTFPEGWDFKAILAELEHTPKLVHTLTGKTAAEIAGVLAISAPNPEGWFFPDTYYFEKNDSDISILKRANKRMQTVLQEEWSHKKVGLPYKTPYEALIMASIVEKETGVKSERARIASVFVNRLRKGMLLQTDPTVIYGIGDKYDGNIRAVDLHKPTAYNTYVISGLPPTPIAMPGQDAIHAALNPNEEEHLYFVARGDGSHQFSISLVEHNRAVNQFQKKLSVRQNR